MRHVVVVVLMWCVVVSSRYDVLFFFIMVQRLFVCGQFRQAKYIRLKTINQINGHEYAAKPRHVLEVSLSNECKVSL